MAQPQQQALSKRNAQIQDWQKFLTSRTDELAGWTKGTGLDPRTLVRIAIREMSRPESKLLECTKASLYMALTASAQLGLEPTGVTGEAYLVPFWDSKDNCRKAQFIPGYQGLTKLVYQTGFVKALWADVVYRDDAFRQVRGSEPRLEHEPNLERDEQDQNIIAAYACARLDNGEVRFEVLSRQEIDKIRKSSKASASGPWVDWFAEMAKKSAVKRLCKLLPRTHFLAKAIAYDDAVDRSDLSAMPGILDVEPVEEERSAAAPANGNGRGGRGAQAAKSAVKGAARKAAAKNSSGPPPASQPPQGEGDGEPSQGEAPAAESGEQAQLEIDPDDLAKRYMHLEESLQAASSEDQLRVLGKSIETLPDGPERKALRELLERRRGEVG